VAARRRVIRYERPWLYPAQEAALFNPARQAIVEASTKAGKTLGCVVWLHEQAALAPESGRNYWWVAPVHSQAKIAYTRLKRYLPTGFFNAWDTTQSIELLNGSMITFKSAVKSDNLYGEDVYAAVVDEASRCSAESWHAVRSTLTATRGPVRIIGNVRGTDNWMYSLARQAETGEDPTRHYARLTAYDAVAGGVIHPDEIAEARRDLPEDVFNELYMAVPSQRTRMFSGQPPVVMYEDLPSELRENIRRGRARIVRSWDIAATENKPGKDPDYLVGTLVARLGNRTYVLDVVRDRLPPDRALDLFIKTAISDNCDQVIEQEPGASGKLLVGALTSQLRKQGFSRTVYPSPPSGDKATRAFMTAADWSQDPSGFTLVDGPWLAEFLEELRYFPHVKHDDQVDALSHGYNHLAGRTYTPGRFRVPGTGR
jgi:predicted phage terminase large subunit-like protein